MGQSACYVSQGMFVIADTTLAGSLFCRLRPGPCRQPSSVLGLPPIPPVPARRPQTGDAKVRTGVRRRSGRVTGAGGEASKARNAGVCLRAGWRLRRPASHTRRQPTLLKRSAYGQCALRFFSRYSGGGHSRKKARAHRPVCRSGTRPNAERRRRTHGGREQVSRQSAQPVHAVKSTLFTHRLIRSAGQSIQG